MLRTPKLDIRLVTIEVLSYGINKHQSQPSNKDF